MPYDKASFLRWSMDDPEVGARLYSARKVMQSFLEALQGGYAQNMMPAFKESLDPDYVARAVVIIDQEWERENRARGWGRYSGSPQFAQRLGPLQQLALVEQLRAVLGRTGTSVESHDILGGDGDEDGLAYDIAHWYIP